MDKKIFMGIAAMAALTLVSCSSDDLNSLSDNSSKNEAISFDGYLGRSAVAVNGSRGSVLEIADLKASTEGFGVFGNYSSTGGQEFGSNWFNNVQVTYDASATPVWKYSPLKYWLPEGHIDFLAYAPYDSQCDNQVSKDNQKLVFEVNSNIKNQKDLLWANATNKKKANNPVKFTFKHALAKIGYTVKTNVVGTGTTITLNKITLAGSTAADPAKAFYTKGSIDLSKLNGTDLWTTSTFPERQNFEWYNGTYNVTTSASHPDDNREKNEDYLFVIPQNFESGHDDLYVIVDYTINYNTGVQATMKWSVNSKIEKNFEQGKAYMINLNIGLTPIEFNAEVTPWTGEGNSETGIDASWD